MNKQKFFILTSILLPALAQQAPGRGTPSGPMYATLMGKVSLDEYQTAIRLLAGAGFVVADDSHLVTITEKGRAIAARLVAAESGVAA